MNSAQLINQTSGDTEYYTPLDIVEAARETMGAIDLDPASSIEANRYVHADEFFTQAMDGLVQPWFGRVWMNHPFGRTTNPLWIGRLITAYETLEISQACCITYACTSEKWFQPLLKFPQCFLTPRTNYYLPNGSLKKGVTKGSVVTYLGLDVERFREAFKRLGVVK